MVGVMIESTENSSVHSRRVVVLHGYGADSTAHWFPWLRDTLIGDGMEASVVDLPRSDAPEARTWEIELDRALGEMNQHTWIVGHSLGGITALRVLAARPAGWRLGGLVLVAGFTGTLPTLPILDDYLAADVDVERLAPRINTRVLVISDDDGFVPPSASKRLAERLDAELVVQAGAGHFLAEDGITALPVVAQIVTRHR